jgi:hypothetical protein
VPSTTKPQKLNKAIRKDARVSLGLALPNDENLPAEDPKCRLVRKIALDVSVELCLPPLAAGLGECRVPAARIGMPVPEAPTDVDDDTP